jgi:cobalamin biosynthesis Mg chelatase CobN
LRVARSASDFKSNTDAMVLDSFSQNSDDPYGIEGLESDSTNEFGSQSDDSASASRSGSQRTSSSDRRSSSSSSTKYSAKSVKTQSSSMSSRSSSRSSSSSSRNGGDAGGGAGGGGGGVASFTFSIIISPIHVFMDIDAPKVNGEKDILNRNAPSIYFILVAGGCAIGLLVFSIALIARMRVLNRRQRLIAEPVESYHTLS